MTKTFYHVTHSDSVDAILAEGFKGGWGDNGFGVYVYDSLHEAMHYLGRGGWDGEIPPDEAAVIEITCPAEDLWTIDIDPSWENPEDYEHVFWRKLDEDDPTARWTPERRLVDEVSATPKTEPETRALGQA